MNLLRSCRPRAAALGTLAGVLLWAVPADVNAQVLSAGSAPEATIVGGEGERYLRLLQLSGDIAPQQWSIRGLSARQVAEMIPAVNEAHPRLTDDGNGGSSASFVRAFVLGPEVRLTHNSALPYGANDGVVWAGRGVTISGHAGFGVLAGPLAMTIAPVAFLSENRPFPVVPLHHRFSPFADPYSPTGIDLPQRFGNERYSRLDPGESTIRLDAGPVAAGVSTAAQHWGPALEQPIILGNNAGGFPHVFVGTSGARRVGIGRLNARLVYGSLAQTEHSFADQDRERRFMSGLVAAFTPAGLPGLEVGAARFFHSPWPEGGVDGEHLRIPLQGLLKAGLPKTGFGRDSVSDVDNQLASVFARWVFPSVGLELYGEYGREDHNWDLRDFLLQPDHSTAYVLGVQKLWVQESGRWLVTRGEILNARRSHLLAVRNQPRFYRHTHTRQGHTHRGQILGAPDGYGGAAGMFAADVYDRAGRWTVRYQRALRGERLPAHSEEDGSEAEMAGSLMVRNSISLERVHHLRRLEMTGGVTGVWELNWQFRQDVFNLSAHLGVRARL